ncbi:PadR family transcriptional regulator [Serratia sp. M24T3]|uniref:PadR family transcriptional regulator n=1 Tax=Serratia sp. M24T3 TaxID=932213 RepID=UPI00025BA689|nr:PadR family transcriptional regulator [Serratia sp. M24T3]EIC85274.1 PadR family transcriptional regulator [Serratia sp. M24T3]
MKQARAIIASPQKITSRRGKTFKNDELLILILYLVRINPTHGYEIIKSIENYSMGVYSPSSGVIYPNLTHLEELGYAKTQVAEGARKKFLITATGIDYLDENEQAVERVLVKLKALVLEKHPVKNLEIHYAIENLKISVRSKMRNENITREETDKIAQAIHEATVKINTI